MGKPPMKGVVNIIQSFRLVLYGLIPRKNTPGSQHPKTANAAPLRGISAVGIAQATPCYLLFFSFGKSVLAAHSIYAGLRRHQSLDWLAAENVGLDDFVDIVQRNPPVPHCVRINHDIRTMLALVEASGLICPHFSFKPERAKLLFESLMQFSFAVRIAARAGLSRRTLISANENMLLKFRHEDNLQQVKLSCEGHEGAGK